MFFNKVASATLLAAVAHALPQFEQTPGTPVPTPIVTPITPTPTPGTPTPGVPTPTPGAGGDGAAYYFQVLALRSGSDIHFASLQASNGALFLGLKSQGATCDDGSDEAATFVLNNGEVSLYAASATPQTLFTDRSGMGQGILGYTTGAQPAGRNSERTGWEVDEAGNLSFDGSSLIACPSGNDDGSYRVLVSAGVDAPAGYKDCLGFSARTAERKTPVSCVYSQPQASW